MTDFFFLTLIFYAVNSAAYAYYLRKNAQSKIEEKIYYRDSLNTALAGLLPSYILNFFSFGIFDNLFQTSSTTNYIAITVGSMLTMLIISILSTHWHIQRYNQVYLMISEKDYWKVIVGAYIKATIVIVLLIIAWVVAMTLLTKQDS